MNHASLFSGIGGFDLAAEALGWENVLTCDNDSFCQRVLSRYWPNSQHFGNIKELNAKHFKGHIDILTGGFPCQPFSLAGKRKGTKDDRYLWPDMLRIIREIRPRWVVAENVYGIVNWNEGLVFEQVHTDLEAEGYEVQSFILPAAGVNAPHRRYRVWIIAYSDRYGQFRGNRHNEKHSGEAGKYAQRNVKQMGTDAYADGTRLEGCAQAGSVKSKRAGILKQFTRLYLINNWRDWPTESALCGNNDGLPKELDGITIPKWRRESVKAYGNAIVPHVALQIFKAIIEIEEKVTLLQKRPD